MAVCGAIIKSRVQCSLRWTSSWISSRVREKLHVPTQKRKNIFWGSLVHKLGELLANVPQLFCEPLFLHTCYVPYAGFYIGPVPHRCHVVIMCYSLRLSFSLFSPIPAPLSTCVPVKLGIGKSKELRVDRIAWRLKIKDQISKIKGLFVSLLFILITAVLLSMFQCLLKK